MRVCASQDGLTVRGIAGTYSILIGIDLQDARRAGCLGFSIQRLDLGPAGAPVPPAQQESRWLPNMLRFPQDTADADETPSTSDRSPIQKFRWGDWTGHPGLAYRYTVTAQYGQWNQLVPGSSVSVEVTTEDPANPNTAVYFNRGAAASNAYNVKFGNNDPSQLPVDQQQKAYAWLSRGLEEAILAFLAQATDNHYGLHAAIYEFQKPNLLQGLKDALGRGVDVQAVYHYRHGNAQDTTWTENVAAANAAGLDPVCVQRKANPQGAISHNKFVVLLKDNIPQAVWTGSTNWTEGALYGQLNVGHAIYDPAVAQTYEKYFQLLHADTDYGPIKDALGQLTPVPAAVPPGPCIVPILSPQSQKDMLDLYASICDQASSLMVCAPFKLAPEILTSLEKPAAGRLRYLLIDKTGSLGSAQDLNVISGDSGNEVSVATTLSSPLHDFQNKLLEGKESYHHAGVHIHSKIIASDPLGPDPVIVFGSANFSDNSTLNNDSNSLIVRGNTAVSDIYVTEFMRMFEHYYFRGKQAQVAAANNQPLGLKEDDSWSAQFYAADNPYVLARRLFAGTDEAGNPLPGSC